MWIISLEHRWPVMAEGGCWMVTLVPALPFFCSDYFCKNSDVWNRRWDRGWNPFFGLSFLFYPHLGYLSWRILKCQASARQTTNCRWQKCQFSKAFSPQLWNLLSCDLPPLPKGCAWKRAMAGDDLSPTIRQACHTFYRFDMILYRFDDIHVFFPVNLLRCHLLLCLL